MCQCVCVRERVKSREGKGQRDLLACNTCTTKSSLRVYIYSRHTTVVHCSRVRVHWWQRWLGYYIIRLVRTHIIYISYTYNTNYFKRAGCVWFIFVYMCIFRIYICIYIGRGIYIYIYMYSSVGRELLAHMRQTLGGRQVR